MYTVFNAINNQILSDPESDSIIRLPWLIRGKELTENMVEYPVRYGKKVLLTPDARVLWSELMCSSSDLADIQGLTSSDIISFLVKVGYELDIENNPYLQQAIELTKEASNLTEPLIRSSYYLLREMFTIPTLYALVKPVGIEYLDSWVRRKTNFGEASIKAIGVRTLHIPAGNVPAISVLSILNGVLTKGDTLIKLPSNDPFTAWSIIRTMMDVDPNHPVVKHLSCAYWKGGDEIIEKELIRPTQIEKIVAWGGHLSINHIKKLIGPGIDLITMDPKFSISVVTKDAFEDITLWKRASFLAAQDVGYFNQDACLNSKIIYVEAPPDRVIEFGKYVYQNLTGNCIDLSTKPKSYPQTLKQEIDSLRFLDDYTIFGGEQNEGAVIISKDYNSKVDFMNKLCSKTVNIVPVKSISDIYSEINFTTQTIGIYPENAKKVYRDDFILAGAQRIVSLGKAGQGMVGMPQDGLELTRRLVKWVVDEKTD